LHDTREQYLALSLGWGRWNCRTGHFRTGHKQTKWQGWTLPDRTMAEL